MNLKMESEIKNKRQFLKWQMKLKMESGIKNGK